MVNYTLIFEEDGIITIQNAPYIEDGFYIQVDGVKISMYGIPLGGGEEFLIGNFDSIEEAINYSIKTF